MNPLILESKNNDNFIKLYLDKDNIAWIERYYIDTTNEEYVNEFCKLLCNGFDKLKENGNVRVYRQYILKDELDQLEFLQNDERWQVVDDENESLLIECEINDAAKCIIEAFVGDFLFSEKSYDQ